MKGTDTNNSAETEMETVAVTGRDAETDQANPVEGQPTADVVYLPRRSWNGTLLRQPEPRWMNQERLDEAYYNNPAMVRMRAAIHAGRETAAAGSLDHETVYRMAGYLTILYGIVSAWLNMPSNAAQFHEKTRKELIGEVRRTISLVSELIPDAGMTTGIVGHLALLTDDAFLAGASKSYWSDRDSWSRIKW